MEPKDPRTCILVFSRGPRREELAKRISGSRCVFRHALRGLLASADGLPEVEVLVVGEGGGEGAGEFGRAGRPHTCLPQRGSTFGERLQHGLEDARALRYQIACVVPIDVPELDGARLREAVEAARAGRVVLGPSPDGGVYLLAGPTRMAEALAGVPWCTDRVHAELLARFPEAHLLAPLADLDRVGDLRALLRSAALSAELRWLLARCLSRAAAPIPLAEPAKFLGWPRRLLPVRGPPGRELVS